MTLFLCLVVFLVFARLKATKPENIESKESKIILGNQIFRDNNYYLLDPKDRIAILTNPTGIFNDNLQHIVDTMHQESRTKYDWEVVAILSPEHGFRGSSQAETGDTFYIDEYTHLPVFSAYEMSDSEINQLMTHLDVNKIIIDMADVGVRLYTFIWTMYKTMESTLEQPIQYIILDRPNPLGGNLIDGPMLNATCCESGYGRVPMPYIHGMTIGEIGNYFHSIFLNDGGINKNILIQVEVIKMKGWQRSMTLTDWSSHNLLFVPPSPNLPTIESIFAFPSTVFTEATTVSEGRGTTLPFTLIGAPFYEHAYRKLAHTLQQCDSSSGSNSNDESFASIRPTIFQPTYQKYNFTSCYGIQWMVNSRSPLMINAYSSSSSTSSSSSLSSSKTMSSPFEVGICYIIALRDLATPFSSFQFDGSWFGHPGTELFDDYTGDNQVRLDIEAGLKAEQISAKYRYDKKEWERIRKPYLLYH